MAESKVQKNKYSEAAKLLKSSETTEKKKHILLMEEQQTFNIGCSWRDRAEEKVICPGSFQKGKVIWVVIKKTACLLFSPVRNDYYYPPKMAQEQ